MVLPGTVETLACERDDWALSMNVLNATSLTTEGIVLMVGLFSEPLKDSCLSVLPISLVAGALSGLTARLSGRECKRSEGRNSLLPSSRSNHGANRAGVLEREAGGYRGRMTESSAISGLHRLLGEARGRDLRLALISNAPKRTLKTRWSLWDCPRTLTPRNLTRPPIKRHSSSSVSLPRRLWPSRILPRGSPGR